ncbi:MAG TPA: NAD(P)/FAD-dependent oxidoreductase [Steroidobacteraceae bacterium]|nr:NAD(P)/FAD-dependent oxidoreductase [Steroidobacteraceae bacterium]
MDGPVRRIVKPDEDRVIIAGAGPAGCTVALYLAQRGVDVLLLEAEATLPIDLRASTFHPPTLDMLDELGVTERMLPLGLISPTYQYRDRRSGEAAVFDLGVLAGVTAHPYRLQCEQYKMTQVAVRMLEALPTARVLFGHRVEQIEQHADRVVVHCETQDRGFVSFTGAYLVGTDGANSRVRKALCIDFEGFTYPERFLVVSTAFDFAASLPNLSNVNYVSDPDEWCVLLRTPSLWRVLVPTDPDADETLLLSDAYIEERLQRIVPQTLAYEIGHRTLYRVHQRVARRYRSRRVLLAGDAAHINNPLGGMGMNGGLHDAFSLAAKLATILDGSGDDALLDLYERQRRGICIRFIQDQTIRNKQLMEERDPSAQAERQREFMRIAADPERARAFLLRTSMIQSLRDADAIA